MSTALNRKKLFIQLVGIIFLLFTAHLLATKFYWYYSIWYFDMPMHAIGGFWSGLFVIWLFAYRDLSNESPAKLILKILFGVLLIGIGWEIFEFSANNYIAANLFLANPLDSISDIFFDLSGGLVAILFYLKRIMLQSKDGPSGDSFKDRP